jgi:hypothetical protein
MLQTESAERSFRVLLRESSRRREDTRDEIRERIAGFLAVALVVSVPTYGLVSGGAGISLVDESQAAELNTSGGFTPPMLNLQAVANRLERNELSPSDVRALQTRLKASGFDPGPLDGIAGARTLAALNAYRQSIRLSPVLAVSRATIGDLPSP